MVLPTGPQPGYNCPLCQESFQTNDEFLEHKATPAHRVRWLKHWYQNNRLLLAKNKNGIVIEPKGNLENVQFEKRSGTVSVALGQGAQKILTLVVKNSGSSPVILREIELLHSCRLVNISDSYGVSQGERYVRVLQDVEYAVECHVQAGSLGVEQVPIAFQFRMEDSTQPFFIIRTVQVSVVDIIAQDCAVVKPYEYKQTSYIWRRQPGSYAPGIPVELDKKDHLPRRVPLKQFNYSSSLYIMACKNFSPTKVAPQYQKQAKKIQAMLKEGLNENNYVTWFQTLLWIEEMQMEKDISFYNMSSVPLKKVPSKYYSRADCVELEVPGLAENRPSVLRGDSVFVTLPGRKDNAYEGFVHIINEKSVYLAFGKEFMRFFTNGMRVDVEFTFSRYPLRVSHRAICLVGTQSLTQLTFPKSPPTIVAPVKSVLPFNRKLENNREQLEAVRNIVSGTSRPAPYIVFGPPGTGKTVTIVEAIKQIYKLKPESHILACAPSNAAADIIAQRLLEHISKAHILRMHAESRSILSIPENLKSVSNICDGGIYFPAYDELMEYKVIVCTFVTCGRLTGAALPVGHVTHVFLDESGHAIEPEAMISLSGIVQKDVQIVLAGDPHQLGPVIRNSQCLSNENLFKDNGLDKSFLERLMEMPMYRSSTGHYNRQVVTKLLNNYRSHEEILKEPNEMFYDSELKACADKVYVNAFCQWEHLPKKNFPIIFHGVNGKDEREGNSPSFFNALEVSTVIGYVNKLLTSRNPKVLAKDIGIITPYRRQVEKIRVQVRKIQGSADIKVGSPEEFQGDERRVIIISTVRASADQLATDQVFKLGFLRNCKRFNVAVTRAKALLIIVGCPQILALDDHWGKLLEFIKNKGGCCGHTIPEANEENYEDLISRFTKLDLRPMIYEEVSMRQRVEAPEWRIEQ